MTADGSGQTPLMRPAASSPAAMRRAQMLEGPIVSTILRLGAPTMAVIVVQILVGVAETYFVSFLGTNALAGVSLVFPVFMLMQMMSNGAIGGGVSSAVSRALGAGRIDDANALVFHALVLSVIIGVIFSVSAVAGGHVLYRALGGRDGSLVAAIGYSDLLFAGSVLVWMMNLLASALRGSGTVLFPAAVTLVGAAALVGLSPSLIFGLGPFPALGVAGAAAAVLIYYFAATVALIVYLRSPRSALKLTLDFKAIEWRLFAEVLRVGGLSSISTVQTNLMVVLVTGAVGLLGADAIAGYGVATRLDYILIPLVFGLGTSVLAMVGTNIGAGQTVRAARIAWTGAALAGGVTELIGITVAIDPHLWLGIFSDDPVVLETGGQYLRLVGPTYGFFGLGILLYFASQGAGRVLWPVLAGTLRLLVAAGGGWLVVAGLGGGLTALFATAAIATVLFGVMIIAALLLCGWGKPRLK